MSRKYYEESIGIRRDLADLPGIAWSLEGIAALNVAEGHLERAVRLFGAASTLRTTTGVPPQPFQRVMNDDYVARAKGSVGEAAFAEAWEAGQKLSLDEAVALALSREPNA